MEKQMLYNIEKLAIKNNNNDNNNNDNNNKK